ncbi:MAG TPA: prepilin-type N-terminal cleavage/methylation domain-containing protein [Patescibacteria group bacterium]|jgi:prepilin-type N-terminal cleavage/methylation domain-containing protein|nr:prepilin-type N-terminal cleavage/methylation domain-containing protein [Patescibacteria group bacterium]
MKRGFTLIEIVIVIAVIAILAAIVTVVYTPFQIKSAIAATETELDQARSKLELFNGLERDYPPNLAGVNYTAPNTVVMTLYTNAPQVRVFQNLTPDQNAQLFLNSCNAHMPIVDGSTTYNTSCAFAGLNIHVKGQKTSNVIFHGPTVAKSDVTLGCGPVCTDTMNNIISDFEAQGGTWPITVPSKQVVMPEPSLQSYGKATKYCLEARYVQYSDVVYHIVSGSTKYTEGVCPPDAELHYP